MKAEEQSNATCNVQEQFSYYPTTNTRNESITVLTLHSINFEFSQIEDGTHEISLVLSTQEQLLAINPTYSSLVEPPTNSSKDGKILINVKATGTEIRLEIVLNETKKRFDPLTVLTQPAGQTKYPLSPQGELNLRFRVENSQPIDNCFFNFNPSLDFKIQRIGLLSTSLKFDSIEFPSYSSASCWLHNVSVCAGEIEFVASTSSLSGTIDVGVTANQQKLFTPVECYLNGTQAKIEGVTDATYSAGNIEFYLQQNPAYYYTGRELYCLNFTTPDQFQLKIDPESREKIDFLALNNLPSSFSVSEENFLGDEPRYIFTFTTPATTKCSLGLDLSSKGWFVDPENMSLDEIPAEIKQKYLTASGSIDGVYFNLTDAFVQEWAAQVTRNQTNPVVIADSIFKNITETLNYPPNWRELEGQNYNESVIEVLNARSGVCRHFARAYAALCICSGLPARTVPGTGFGFLNETYKKNHEWVEVYLPGYGWVTVDPSWGQEFLLSDQHASITYWTYQEKSLNVTYANETTSIEPKLASIPLISFLIKFCEQNINRSQNNQRAEILLDQAKFFSYQGEIHKALLNIAEAYMLLHKDQTNNNTSTPELNIPAIFLSIVIIALIGLYAIRKKRTPTRTRLRRT